VENTTEITSIYWIGTSLMLVICLGIFFLVLSYRNHFFKIKQNEADLLLKASLEGERMERNRIAADLHDSVSGDLNAIKNYLLFIEKTNSLPGNQEILDEIKNSVSAALENTRLISYKLMPPMLEHVGLIATLHDFLEQLSKKTQLEFSLTSKQDDLLFTASVSYEIFRIVQEFTTNIIKYGDSTNTQIIILGSDKETCIEIIDNGKSFDFYHAMQTSNGTGLKNINSRVKSINATLLQKTVEVGNHFLITLKN
jgi:signal transduction histidine kinase